MSLEEELGSRLREVIRAEQRAFPERLTWKAG